MRAYLFVLLAWCAAAQAQTVTPMDLSRPPPADWPKLQERIVRVPQSEVDRTCKPAPGFVIKSCAVIYFADERCVILLADGADYMLEHERQHCSGYDHPGESYGRDAWERYKARSK